MAGRMQEDAVKAQTRHSVFENDSFPTLSTSTLYRLPYSPLTSKNHLLGLAWQGFAWLSRFRPFFCPRAGPRTRCRWIYRCDTAIPQTAMYRASIVFGTAASDVRSACHAVAEITRISQRFSVRFRRVPRDRIHLCIHIKSRHRYHHSTG